MNIPTPAGFDDLAFAIVGGGSMLTVGALAVFCVLGGPFILVAIYILSTAIERGMRHSRDVSLKLRLLETGMTAAEIERVVNAGRGTGAEVAAKGKPKPPADPLAKMV